LPHRFLVEQKAVHVLPPWQDVMQETMRAVQNERASEVFLDVLKQLLASGEVMLASNTQHPEQPAPGKTVVGYLDPQYVYLLPEVAFRAVEEILPLKFTTSAIGSQLREDGILVPGTSQSHLTIQLRVRGSRVRLWRLRRDLFEGEAED